MKLPRDYRKRGRTEVKILSPQEVPAYADDLRALLSKAGGYLEEYMSVEDVIINIACGRMIGLIAFEEGVPFLCMVAEILTYPRKKVFNILQIAGTEMGGFWKHMYVVEGIAKKLGCSEVTAVARKGVVAILKEVGYREKATVVSKALGGSWMEN